MEKNRLNYIFNFCMNQNLHVEDRLVISKRDENNLASGRVADNAIYTVENQEVGVVIVFAPKSTTERRSLHKDGCGQMRKRFYSESQLILS